MTRATTRGGPRFSIPTRIFLAFAITLASFTGVAVTSVAQHDETARRSTITDRSIFSALMTLYPAALQKETREAYAAAHARATAQT